MSCPWSYRFPIAFVLLALAAGSARADDISACVANPTQLRNALVAWEATDSDDVTRIKLRQGTYDMGGAELDYRAEDPGELRLLGGYTDAGCTTRSVDPGNTTIDGAGGSLQLTSEQPFYANGITFSRFDHPDHEEGIEFMANFTSDEARVELRRVVFRRNSTVYFYSGTDITVDNVLVVEGVGSAGLYLFVLNEGQAVIQNSTFADNLHEGLRTASYDDARVLVYDSVLWGNQTDFRSFDNPGHSSEHPPFFSHTHYATINGSIDQVASTFGNAGFVDMDGGNYRLLATSPGVNSGTGNTPLGLSSVDIAGGPRVMGSKVDRGAYESAIDDLNNFTVTTLADNGSNVTPTPGSLRAAIRGSNLNAGASKISFNVPGNCPAVFSAMPAVLPDITSDVTIDGYTQPESLTNGDLDGFDAKLCVLMITNTLTHALRVSGAGRLTVRGIHFAGFSDAAVKFQAGSGHVVQGNRFESGFLLPANKVGVHVTAQSGRVYIGGADDPAAINLFGGNTSAAIFLDNAAGGSVLINNRIGAGGTVSTGVGDGTGVSIFHSPNNILLFNVIENAIAGGVAISGSGASGNRLQWNRLGREVPPGGNDLAGVLIGLGAHDNIVGAVAGSDGGGNTITYNGGPGGWITASAGAGNRVNANTIHHNDGIAIDLGSIGPLANDASDGDAGGNGLQNYASVDSAGRTEDGRVHVSLSLETNTFLGVLPYRIDVYSSSLCNSSDPTRGEAVRYLGSVTMNASLGFGTATASFPGLDGYVLGAISATATAPDGSTSEIGNCGEELALGDTLFRDQFE